MYRVGDIFYEDKEYPKRAEFCNDNNLIIIEIEADADGKRRFQIQEIPVPTEKEFAQKEINLLKSQLSDMDYKTSKYVDGDYTEEEWQEIVNERKFIRGRIRELEKTLENMA